MKGATCNRDLVTNCTLQPLHLGFLVQDRVNENASNETLDILARWRAIPRLIAYVATVSNYA